MVQERLSLALIYTFFEEYIYLYIMWGDAVRMLSRHSKWSGTGGFLLENIGVERRDTKNSPSISAF